MYNYTRLCHTVNPVLQDKAIIGTVLLGHAVFIFFVAHMGLNLVENKNGTQMDNIRISTQLVLNFSIVKYERQRRHRRNLS